MYEINIAELRTDSAEFPIIKTATLDHYHELYRAHTPSGQIVRLRTARPPEAIAGSYTPIILSHAQSMASAFNAGLYASGFALLRPMLEALFKQQMLGDYQGDDDQWKAIPPKSVRVTKSSLKKLATEAGSPDIMPVWQHLSPLLADFVHGGKGQLTSNPISDEGWPQYPAVWFDTAMTAAVMSVLVTSGWFWAHIGDEDRCDAIKALIASRDWAKVTTMRNGQEVRIVAR